MRADTTNSFHARHYILYLVQYPPSSIIRPSTKVLLAQGRLPSAAPLHDDIAKAHKRVCEAQKPTTHLVEFCLARRSSPITSRRSPQLDMAAAASALSLGRNASRKSRGFLTGLMRRIQNPARTSSRLLHRAMGLPDRDLCCWKGLEKCAYIA